MLSGQYDGETPSNGLKPETPMFVYEERAATSYKDFSAGSEQKFSSCRLVLEINLVLVSLNCLSNKFLQI